MPASFTVVDGLEIPVHVSGHPGLELCNTFAGYNGGTAREYLASYRHLTTWAASAGLIDRTRAAGLQRLAAARPADAEAVVARAREVRARLYEVLLQGATSGFLDRVADDLQVAAGHLRLLGDGAIRFEISAEAGLAAPLHAAVWRAGELLVSPALNRVRACPGAGCGWLFLDRSGRRRWCTMGTCGNRAKARRFAARHHRAG